MPGPSEDKKRRTRPGLVSSALMRQYVSALKALVSTLS
jgi:hypothetical protein